jgi:hypothetical protein
MFLLRQRIWAVIGIVGTKNGLGLEDVQYIKGNSIAFPERHVCFTLQGSTRIRKTLVTLGRVVLEEMG